MDWIDQALLEDDQIREQKSSEYNLSGEWCTQWMYDPNKIHDVVEQLADLRQTFTNFAKLLERDDIEFRFSTGEDLGTACAYFRSIDGNRFSQPVIVIDTGLFKRCTSSLDPIIGTILHEIAHILFTRKLFRITKRNLLRTGLGKSFSNLLEDYRIERALVDVAPGYARYLASARQTILIDDWLQRILKEWEKSDEWMRRVSLIAAFIRFPRIFRIAPELRVWKTSEGKVFFDQLRKILKTAPRTEDEVMLKSRQLLLLFPRDSKHDCLISDLARIQIAADALEAILRQASSATNATPEGIIRLLAERDARATSKSNEVVEIPNLTLEGCDHARIRHERAATLPQEAVEWTRARDSLQPQIAALRNKMCFHSRPRRVLLGGQAEGRLDARRIWKAPFDTEIFGRYEDRKSNRFDDCTCAILLDSSSSMYDYDRYQQAFRMAVLLVEGLDRLIRIRVFSHFYDDVNVVVLEHQQPRRSMHCYQPRESNVDSQAILLVGSLLRNVPGHRVLISLSDGLPCSYRGLNAIAETRQAVETVRSTGVRVLGVNIGHAWNASIYAPFALHIPDAEKLPQEIEKLVIGELRKLID